MHCSIVTGNCDLFTLQNENCDLFKNCDLFILQNEKKLQYNLLQCNAMQCNAMQYKLVRNMKCNVMQYNAMKHYVFIWNVIL